MTASHPDRTVQVNHLSHFLLTLELLPALRRGSQERGEARVVIVSSASHTSAVFNPANMNGEQSYSRYTFYGNSKLYNVSPNPAQPLGSCMHESAWLCMQP